MKVYTGIGSRQTPSEILALFERLAFALGRYGGWVLRSGCAQGADSAFERGAYDASDDTDWPGSELYLPWPNFEGRTNVTRARPQREALPIAAQFHPAWDRLSQGAQKLHARNVHQILGPDVTKPVLSRFVVCWTPGGDGGGGTGQALRIARHYGVEIVDAGSSAGLARVKSFVEGGANG